MSNERENANEPLANDDVRFVQEAAHDNGCQLEVSEYWQYVEDFDLTDAQKTELLQTLWNIMATFVDIGFGVDSVQHIIPALVRKSLEIEDDPVERKDTIQHFNSAAEKAARKEKS